MTPENFVYWLNGAFELGGIKTMNADQCRVLLDHIALTLKKVTPERQTIKVSNGTFRVSNNEGPKVYNYGHGLVYEKNAEGSLFPRVRVGSNDPSVFYNEPNTC